jgi:hypothetical protein
MTGLFYVRSLTGWGVFVAAGLLFGVRVRRFAETCRPATGGTARALTLRIRR